MRITRTPPLLVLLFFALTPAWAQSKSTANTIRMDDPDKRPVATLAAVEWMVGSWTGQAFGGRFEETWSPASAGTMVSTFKLIHDDQPSMYEFQMIVEEEDSLTLKLKHFNADFSAWEEKEEFVSFPLVKLNGDTAWFDGLTYRRLGPNQLEVFVALGEGGELREERLLFERSGSGETSAAATAEADTQPSAARASPVGPASPPAPESSAGATQIYVGNLPFSVTEDQVHELFARYGNVSSVRLVTDPDSGRSRGTAYVEMVEGAEAAIEALDGGRIGKRLITVKTAGPRAEP